MKYQVTIGARRYEVEVAGDQVRIDGVEHRAELRPIPGTPLRLLTVDGQSSAIPVASPGPGTWTLHHCGRRYDIGVLDERTQHIRSLVGPGQAHAGPALLKAPMPGLVVRILVSPGQEVAPGDGLLVLEAMKMENELKAPGAAVIDRVEVAAGQAVEKGAPLISFRT